MLYIVFKDCHLLELFIQHLASVLNINKNNIKKKISAKNGKNPKKTKKKHKKQKKHKKNVFFGQKKHDPKKMVFFAALGMFLLTSKINF